MKKVLAIGLDGYEGTVAEKLMASGDLPALAGLSRESARFKLQHGADKRTGLAWEHFSSGVAPDIGKRWSAVYFDPESYRVHQKGTIFPPFLAETNVDTVVFDVPYFDLSRAPRTRGITSWGAHDPGTNRASNPGALLEEVTEKFGEYPARKWIYGYAWPSPEDCEEMGEALVRGVKQRTAIASWLLGERLADWDLGIIVVSELHSAIEALWHGIDQSHPLHKHPSAENARTSLINVYKAVDRLVGLLSSEFPQHELVVFNMHGMGANESDVPSMLLLPELLYRLQYERPFFLQPDSWTQAEDGVPIDIESWDSGIETPDCRSTIERLSDFAHRKVPSALKSRIGLDDSKRMRHSNSAVMWMPAARYQPYWRDMTAFALPSYYDGSIRINLEGRERFGKVSLESYATECERIETILGECRDPNSGQPIVEQIEYHCKSNPLDLHQTQGDMIVVWKAAPLAFEHPQIGQIGPVPYRRTGGHTGHYGFAYVKSDGLSPGEYGERSAYDVVPTLLKLLDQPTLPAISGKSLFP